MPGDGGASETVPRSAPEGRALVGGGARQRDSGRAGASGEAPCGAARLWLSLEKGIEFLLSEHANT